MLTWIAIAVAAWGAQVGVRWPLILVLAGAAVGWRRYLPGWTRALLTPTRPDEPPRPPSFMVRALLTASTVYLVLYLATDLVTGRQSLADWFWLAVPTLGYYAIVWVFYLRMERSWAQPTTPRRPQ